VVSDCKLYSAFGPIDRKCSEFKALATNINGTQTLDLDGFGPLHYYMPGYFDAIKGKLVAIDKSGSASTPFSTCAGGPYGCRMTNSENLTIHAQQQSAWEGEEMKWDDPLSEGLAYALLDSYECMSAEELVRNGYVKPDQESIASSARMTPSAAKFCVISGVYYLTDSTSDDTINITLGSVDKSGGRGHNNYLPADRAASLFMGPQLSVYNSQGEARFAGQQLVDVSDFVYSGAHPGHNAEDIMYPFDELGYSVSPADRFEPQPGLYDELMDTGR
jgi:hypothetical protein